MNEKKKCEQILLLLQDAILLKEDFHYGFIENLGYVFLEYINQDGSVEQATILKNAIEIYNYFMKIWKYDYVYRYMEKQSVESFNYEKELVNLPIEMINTMNTLEQAYQNRAAQILAE